MGRFSRGGMLCAAALSVMLTLTAAASPVSDIHQTEARSLGDGARLVVSTATASDDRPEVLYTVTAPAADWTPAIGGAVHGRELVQDMTPIGVEGEAAVSLNGDHFSFQTGIPLGMSISGGRLITSPVPAYNAEDYYFHALGITADGTVLTGENPTLYIQGESGEQIFPVDRLNRTRESWEGGQVSLFTPDYGASTGTDYSGVEYIIRVDEGEVAAGSGIKGTVLEENWDNDSPLKEGTVVLSLHMMVYVQMEPLAIGDEVSFQFSFEEEEWNAVEFAVGGNLTAVAEGEVQTFDYTVGAFTAAAPRSAFGVRADGTYVLAAVDGRSEASGGLTANEMATYMAEELDCEYAILLDGGGSTALAVAGEDGVLQTANVPSEERPVGNAVLLVRTPGADDATGKNAGSLSADAKLLLIGGIVCVAVAAAVIVLIVLRRGSKADGKNN